MKKILFVLAIAGFIFSSCGNKKKKTEDNVGYHTHEDGTVHSNDAHNNEHSAKPNQESFEVKEDNYSDHEHPHGDTDKEDHKHEHGDADGDGHDHDKDEHGDTAEHDHDHEHGEHK